MPELLLDEATADEVLVPAPVHGGSLQVLTARADEGEVVDLLQSRRIEQVVEELRSQADVVIFDSPPVTEVADALPLATAVDAVVIVVRFGRTRRDKLADARLVLSQLGVLPAGVIAVTRQRARVLAADRTAERRDREQVLSRSGRR